MTGKPFKKRGTMLVAFVAFLPMVMLVYAALLSQLDAIYAETSRMQHRTQARLLAESAVVVLQDQAAHGVAAKGKMEGAIQGIGRYAIEAANTPNTLRVVGSVENRREHTDCVIDCMREAKAIRPVAVRYQRAKASPARRAEEPSRRPRN